MMVLVQCHVIGSAPVAGIGRELENLILENAELLATKYAMFPSHWSC